MTLRAALPIDAVAVLNQAIAALDTPQAATMLPALDRALRSAPQDGRLWYVKGLIHRQMERRELALPALQRAAQLSPKDAKVAHALALTRYEAGLPCLDEYGRALQLSPGDPVIVGGLTLALIAARKAPQAIAGLERILRRSPLWHEGHGLLSQLRWSEGERDGFARSFGEALAANPKNLPLRRQHIHTLLHARAYEDVERAIAEGRSALGDDPLFDTTEAIVRAETGDAASADRLFSAVAGLPDPNMNVRRVRHLLLTGRPEQASQVIDEWLGTEHDTAFWPYAATAWRMTGDPRSQWLEGHGESVGVYDIADRLPPLDQLAATLRDLHTLSGQPLAQSLRGGTQTDGNLFHRIDPVIVQLREAIRTTGEEHAASLPKRDPDHPTLRAERSPIRFAGAWSVRLREGGYHANHVHPMGWISSALYVALPPDLGQKDHSGWLTLGNPHDSSFPLDLPPTRMVEPKPGRLALFPSWMWHGTRPFGVGERLTVAFDVAVPQH